MEKFRIKQDVPQRENDICGVLGSGGVCVSVVSMVGQTPGEDHQNELKELPG